MQYFILGAIVAFAIVYFFFVKKKKKPAATDAVVDSGVCKAHELVKAINTELVSEKDKKTYGLKYQGGYFLIHFPTEDAYVFDLMYPEFVESGAEDAELLLIICNITNNRARGWHAALERNESEGKVSISLHCTQINNTNVQQLAQDVKGAFISAFHIAREFEDDFKKQKQSKDTDTRETFNNLAYQSSLARYHRSLVMGHADDKMDNEFPRSERLSMANIIEVYRSTDMGALLAMRIVDDSRVETITDVAQILDFNIRNYIKALPSPEKLESLILELTFEHVGMIISLRKLSFSSPKSLLFNCNIVNTASVFNACPDDYSSLSTIEVQLGDASHEYWEAKYQWDDAHDKAENNQQSELTEEQRWLLEMKSSTFNSDLYWGKKFFNNKCYIQSLWHFRRFAAEKYERWSELQDFEKQAYSEVCKYIAIVYLHLDMPEKAHFYISVATRIIHDELSVIALVNCLCLIKDPMAIDTIYNFLNSLVEVADGIDEDDDATQNFVARMHAFLNKRALYAYINIGDLVNAEKLAKEMIEKEIEAEYATTELQYILFVQGKTREEVEHKMD